MKKLKYEIDKQALDNLYSKEGKSLNEIASVFNCGWNTILRRLKLYNIPKRKFCENSPDYSGLKFGKIKILRKIKGYFWLCKCDCGTEKEIDINNLKSKETVSCGCHRKVNSFKGFGNLSATHWNHIKTQAEQRGFEFNITIEYAWNLFLKQKERCSMSGIKIYISRNIANKKLQKTASLDRIDSKKGYIEGNVQWIHKTINKMKNNILEEDFINFCRIICNHRESEIDLDFP